MMVSILAIILITDGQSNYIVNCTFMVFHCAGFPTLALSDYTNTFGFRPGTSTLIVTNAERVDFDTMRRFAFTVTATDVLDDSLVSNATVIINLLDYNDLSPVIHNDG